MVEEVKLDETNITINFTWKKFYMIMLIIIFILSLMIIIVSKQEHNGFINDIKQRCDNSEELLKQDFEKGVEYTLYSPENKYGPNNCTVYRSDSIGD